MPAQLRTYTIRPGAMDQWVVEWKEQVKPLREKLGFEIQGAWVIPETHQFVWIMAYNGPKKWEDLDTAYFTAPERKAMEPNPARLIEKMEEQFVTSAL